MPAIAEGQKQGAGKHLIKQDGRRAIDTRPRGGALQNVSRWVGASNDATERGCATALRIDRTDRPGT
jgi:hypothetical protein